MYPDVVPALKAVKPVPHRVEEKSDHLHTCHSIRRLLRKLVIENFPPQWNASRMALNFKRLEV